MAYQPTTDQVRALAELHNQVHANTLLNSLVSRDTATLLNATDPLLIYRAQGRIAALQELLALIRTAPEMLARR